MKITKIVQQERQKDRYSIFVDEKYAFSLSEGALLESKLASGQELTAGQLKDWKQESAEDKVAAAALRYAAMRQRSAWEMGQYLKRKNAPPALSDKILNKLTDIRLVDDAKFATAWVANRRLLRPTSKRKLQQELRAKRVADDIIGSVLRDDAETTDERTALRQLVAKKRNLSKYKAEPLKLMQYLARQGFSYDDIKSVLGEAPDD